RLCWGICTLYDVSEGQRSGKPPEIPTIEIHIACLSTSFKTPTSPAPSATRSPISCVRCVTEWDHTVDSECGQEERNPSKCRQGDQNKTVARKRLGNEIA